MKKGFILLFSVLFLMFAVSGCDTSNSPTSPDKEELGASSDPQPVPTEILIPLAESGGEGINTEHVYSTDPDDGSVDFDVDTSQSAPSHIPGIGEHAGELKNLEVKIIFNQPYFYTDAGLAGYYIGLPMNYEVRLKNVGNRTFKHLDIVTIQEYYETSTCDRWWYPYPQEVNVAKGEAMPGDSMQYWRDVEIGAGEELVLQGQYTAPMQTCSGLDQIHLIIQHTNNGALHAATMYYNPEAAVYCPPPPGTTY